MRPKFCGVITNCAAGFEIISIFHLQFVIAATLLESMSHDS
jgi:hypothetical protein